MKFSEQTQIGRHWVTTVSCTVDAESASLQEIIRSFEVFLRNCGHKVSLSYLIHEEPVNVPED